VGEGIRGQVVETAVKAGQSQLALYVERREAKVNAKVRHI
jgi:hypothetical protein